MRKINLENVIFFRKLLVNKSGYKNYEACTTRHEILDNEKGTAVL